MKQQRAVLVAMVGALLLASVSLNGPGASAEDAGAAFSIDTVSVEHALGIENLLASPTEMASRSEAELDKNEQAVHALLTSLDIGDAATPGSGHAGTVVDPITGGVTIWWAGGLPERARVALDRTELPGGVTLRSAKYSRYDLIGRVLKNQAALNGGILAIPREDGAGIVITTSRNRKIDMGSAASALGVPVTFVEDGELVNTAGKRQDSNQPWWGGAMMISSAGGVCSTGFSVLLGNEGRMLSAAHCDITGNLGWFNGNLVDPRVMNTGFSNVSVIPSMDSMMFNPQDGTAGRVHTGGIWSTATEYRPVSATAVNNVGDTVSTDGANSGEHAGQAIYDDAIPLDGACNGYDCTLVGAKAPVDALVNVGGDSGGPVFHRNVAGTLTAKGIIKASPASSFIACDSSDYRFNPGTYTYFGVSHTKCYKRVLYYPIQPLLTAWGVTIETGSF